MCQLIELPGEQRRTPSAFLLGPGIAVVRQKADGVFGLAE